MTKRQLATAYRGYHGLESQYYALSHMSNGTMSSAQLKNERLLNRHVEDMKHLTEQERMVKNRTDRDLRTLRDDFSSQLAYQYVYKNHSFKRYYKSQPTKRNRPVSDKPELYDMERKKSTQENIPRPLGSLRQVEHYKNELKLPAIQTPETADVQSPRVNMMGEKGYTELKEDHVKVIRDETKLTSFPSIQTAMTVEIKFKHKAVDDDKGSIVSAPPAGLDADSDTEEEKAEMARLKSQNMAQHLMIMKLRQQQEFEAPRRLLPSTPEQTPDPKEEKREAWRRILPEPLSRPATVFPGNTRTSMAVKNMMKREVSDVLGTWSHSSRRQEMVELTKEQNKLELAERPIPHIDQHRPLSAIFRDFKEYKRQHEEWSQVKEHELDKQSVVVRQMSPKPRVASPVLQRRSDYVNRTATPLRATRNIPESTKDKTKPLRRTDSEKLTSVSRTSSFRELPEEELNKLQEHAHLTSTERIELEKQRLPTTAEPEKGQKGPGNSPKVKRRLPPTPCSRGRPRIKRNFETKMPNKTISLATVPTFRQDVAIINDVNNANEANVFKSEESKYYEMDKAREPSSYTPIIKQSGETGIGTTTYTEESLHRMKLASILYDQQLWPKLKKRMSFQYENFTRAPPDRKKQLEIRAKNRRKIQTKNAQLESETQMKGTATASRTERPSTRVSFCENVMVIQTISP